MTAKVERLVKRCGSGAGTMAEPPAWMPEGSEEERKAAYEERARAALLLLQESIRVSGIEQAAISLKHDRWGVPYVEVSLGSTSQRVEMTVGHCYGRLTHIMQEILRIV